MDISNDKGLIYWHGEHGRFFNRNIKSFLSKILERRENIGWVGKIREDKGEMNVVITKLGLPSESPGVGVFYRVPGSTLEVLLRRFR